MNLEPEEITRDIDDGTETASFKYYDGIAYAKDKQLQFTTSFSDVRKGTHYMVCCGYVMAVIKPIDFPGIKRRDF